MGVARSTAQTRLEALAVRDVSPHERWAVTRGAYLPPPARGTHGQPEKPVPAADGRVDPRVVSGVKGPNAGHGAYVGAGHGRAEGSSRLVAAGGA
jgi:hypothetical protein